MDPLPLTLQAYRPQIPFGDWQLVILADGKRNIVAVERWHSSEKTCHPLENCGQLLRINTGIRAFRRQMPILAAALEEIPAADLSNEEIVHAVFEVLASVYKTVPEREGLDGADDESPRGAEFAKFFQYRERAALAALG